jgi:hypothetical protein
MEFAPEDAPATGEAVLFERLTASRMRLAQVIRQELKLPLSVAEHSL